MKNKHQWARIRIIDRELCKHDRVKTKDLVKIIAEEVIEVKQRTIEKDIELMKEDSLVGFSAPIEFDSKKKAYFYKDPDFTIQAFGLKSEDIMALQFYAKTFEQYKGIKIFEDILKAIERVIDNISIAKKIKESIANKTLFQTEKVLLIKGIELIEPLMKAIIEEQEIRFDYRKFQDPNPQKRILSPIFLKEDKNFWYVIGVLDGKNSLSTFALDRISNLVVTNKYFTPPAFDTKEYFKYSFGITVSEEKPIKIILSFKPYQGNYIKALPIHETQEVIKDSNKELRISVVVKPSYEFYSKILSYGEDVKVILPKSIAIKVKNKHSLASQRYK